MRKLLLASVASLIFSTSAFAEDIKIGIILGFTGPIESLTPAMAQGAEAAIAEVSASGQLLSGSTVTAIRADSTCIDSAVASANAEKLITADKVNGIMGADCSGVTGAILANVAMANGMVMISPSATSPALSTAEDNGLFFRTAPSDARQGAIMSSVLMDRGITSVAVSYTNNDYGKGLADAFQAAYVADGGSVTINAAHEEGKADYSSEVGALASAGGQALVVAGYIDGAGKNVTQGAIDTGAFDMFLFPDGMIGANLENFGTDLDGSLGTVPGLDPTNPAASAMVKIGEANGFAGGDAFVGESYDAAALMLLAMASAKSSDPQVYKDHVMKVANGTGEKIYPGELAKGIKLASYGVAIDYVGASSVTLIGPGEAAGNFREIEIQNGKMVDVNYR
tara:strand:- start:259 stop:1446 length:1188 start_codon:yes stop_codon:yes gene_type:complete